MRDLGPDESAALYQLASRSTGRHARLQCAPHSLPEPVEMPALRSLCPFVALAALAAPALGQTPDAAQADVVMAAAALRRSALASNDAYAIVQSLTAEVGPRPAGS